MSEEKKTQKKKQPKAKPVEKVETPKGPSLEERIAELESRAKVWNDCSLRILGE